MQLAVFLKMDLEAAKIPKPKKNPQAWFELVQPFVACPTVTPRAVSWGACQRPQHPAEPCGEALQGEVLEEL